MKVHCNKEALLIGVNTVQKAISSKNTLPVLQSILLHAEGQQLIFKATDMEIGIRCEVPAEIETEGIVVLPAKLFTEIVRKLPDTIISLELKDGSINIKYYNSEIFLKGYDPEEFPLLPDLLDPLSFTISTNIFKKMIHETVFACSNEENRPVFTGLLLEIDGQTIRMIATDTHRLAFRLSEIPNDENIKFSGIIPSKTMSEIYRLLKDDDEFLTIRYNASQVSFQFGSVHLLSRLIEGKFPNYKLVIPQSCETKVYLSVKEFTEAVERASLLARDNVAGASIVRLAIEDGILRIDHTTDIGKISEKIFVEKEGKDIAISFNAKFILDALKVIDNEEILFELSGPQSPGVIRSINNKNYIYLLLPVRTY
ncbi:MAG: DNA polymerase III subunit beta [Desulfitobacteriaceae bacterium]